MLSILYPFCLAMGHEWIFMRRSRFFNHYQCRWCDRRKKEDR